MLGPKGILKHATFSKLSRSCRKPKELNKECWRLPLAIAGQRSRSVEVIVRPAVIALTVVSATATSSAQRAGDLKPAESVYSSPSLAAPYGLAVRDALVGEHDYRKCQMLVLPSFGAEWVVYIVQDDVNRSGRLFHKVMRTQLWGDMMRRIERDAPNPNSYSIGPQAQAAALARVTKSVDMRTVDLDAATVAILEGAWSDMLARTRYPAQEELGLDGTSYIAANWSRVIGLRSGETWSPEKGTPAYDLVAIAEKLRDLALASRNNQAKLKLEATTWPRACERGSRPSSDRRMFAPVRHAALPKTALSDIANMAL